MEKHERYGTTRITVLFMLSLTSVAWRAQKDQAAKSDALVREVTPALQHAAGRLAF